MNQSCNIMKEESKNAHTEFIAGNYLGGILLKVSQALLEASVWSVNYVFCLLRQASCSYDYVTKQSNWSQEYQGL